MYDSPIIDSKPALPPRRKYTKEFKAEIVAQCDRGEQSLAQIAMAHQINANLVRKWQRLQHEQQSNNKLIPVQVSESVTPVANTGSIEINLGSLSLKVSGAVDCAYVASLVRALQ